MAHIQIGDLAPRISYQVGSTPQTVFDAPFPFFENSDLDVYVDGVLQILDSDYSVTGALVDAGGTVTFTNPVSNALVAIVRNLPIKRTTDYPTSGPFQINALNTDLDKIVAWQQELGTRILRSLRPPDSDPDGDFVLPPASQRAGHTLGFDSLGTPVAMVDSNGYPASVFGATLIQAANAAAARALLLMTTAGSAMVLAVDSAAQKALLDVTTNTQAEAEAGAVNTGKMTPLRVAQAIAVLATPLAPRLMRAPQVFTANGTYNKPAGLLYVEVHVIGGGGGSPGSGSGGAGGTSSFGSHASATGGGGGTSGGTGGAGGTGSNGNINRTGQRGTVALSSAASSGGNAAGPWGGPGGAPQFAGGAPGGGAGSPVNNSATGGGGGYSYKRIDAATLAAAETVTVGAAGTAGSSGGLAGSAGQVIIFEYGPA